MYIPPFRFCPFRTLQRAAVSPEETPWLHTRDCGLELAGADVLHSADGAGGLIHHHLALVPEGDLEELVERAPVAVGYVRAGGRMSPIHQYFAIRHSIETEGN